jgi:hypothetical protein
MPPQDMMDVGIPTPRKLTEASRRMDNPMVLVAITIIGPKILGKTYLSKIRKSVAPMARAASI